MTPTEKAAFIKGLIEGCDLKWDKKETKIIEAIVELLSDLANEVQELDEDVSVLYDDVEDLVDAVDELGEMVMYYNSGDFDFDDELDDEDFMYEIRCEKCGSSITVDEDTLLDEGELRCPSCGETIELEFDCDCEECAEGCSNDQDDK